MRKINVSQLKISERDLEDNLYKTHVEVVQSLRDVCEPESKGISISATLLAKLPFGDSREVEVIAWTDGPSGETVNSTLEPSLMGAAFLREAGAGTVS